LLAMSSLIVGRCTEQSYFCIYSYTQLLGDITLLEVCMDPQIKPRSNNCLPQF